MAGTYDVGDKIKVTGTFKEENELGDPVTVRALYKSPSEVVTTIVYPDSGITKVSMGIYSFEIPIDEAGTWYYRMDDGVVNVAVESYFQVRKSNLL